MDVEIKPGLDAEESIDKLIASRYSPEDDRRIAQAWAESAMRHNLGARAALRQEWAAHYRRLIHVHERLAEHNRERLAHLIDERV